MINKTPEMKALMDKINRYVMKHPKPTDTQRNKIHNMMREWGKLDLSEGGPEGMIFVVEKE